MEGTWQREEKKGKRKRKIVRPDAKEHRRSVAWESTQSGRERERRKQSRRQRKGREKKEKRVGERCKRREGTRARKRARERAPPSPSRFYVGAGGSPPRRRVSNARAATTIM